MARRRQTRPWSFLLCLLLVALTLGEAHTLGEDLYPTKAIELSPAAPQMGYPQQDGGGLFGNHRLIIWILIQQHFYLGSFILGTPMIAWLLSCFAAFRRRQNATEAKTFNTFAQDILRLTLLFYPITVISGLILTGGFLLLYPAFFKYLSLLFQPVIFLYAFCFFLETLLLYSYAYTRYPWKTKAQEGRHLLLGFLTCLNGVVIIALANALMSFMMSPQGVDSQGRFQGDWWAIIQTPFWNPLNVHRILASMMFSGATISAAAAFSMLKTTDPHQKAYYDQLGHTTLLIGITNLFLLPFAGYWFAKKIFIFRQQMGMTLMGGALGGLFVIQAMLIGLIFMALIYYLWQGAARLEGAERYRPAAKYLLLVLVIAFLIWATPHTLQATPSEWQRMGGSQHPVVGNYGTMRAKITAINTMILTVGVCLILLKRCNRILTIPWRRGGNVALALLFGVAEIVILFLGIYGTKIPAHLGVALALPQFLIAIVTLLLGCLFNLLMLRGAKTLGPIRWGKLPTPGILTLFALAFFVATTMALMGYIRSSARLNWHVMGIMEDVTPWADTPSLLAGMGMVLINVFFFALVSFLTFSHARGGRALALFSEPSDPKRRSWTVSLPREATTAPTESHEIPPS